MAVESDGSYGIPKGLICSFPLTIENGKYTIVKD
jgi:malate/lactate dehydrogenase